MLSWLLLCIYFEQRKISLWLPGYEEKNIYILMSNRDKKNTSRQLAVKCLVRWDKERHAVQPYIDSIIYGSILTGSDRQLAVMLVLGVLRQLQYLDGIISRFAKHPIRKMKPLMLMTLRVGVYQLMFLERIPDSAAVNETVKILKEERQPKWIINFANGVMRNISREKEELSGPERAGDKGSAVLNHPEWILQRWKNKYGPEKAHEICLQNNKEPFLVLRVNTNLLTSDALTEMCSAAGVDVRKGSYAPDALVIESPAGPLSSLPGYGEGFFHVQDEAAQLVTLLMGPFDQAGYYLDACAGLGGKTCQLVQLLPLGSKLLAVEPSNNRFQLLQENIRRLGMDKNVTVFHGRVGNLEEEGLGQFSGILVDAPCSGTGVIRRHPDIRWNRNLEDLQAHQHQQLEILQQASHLLLPAGILVYATCSMEPEENEQVVEEFLARNSGFSLSNAKKYLPRSAHKLVSPEGYFATTPAEGLDGFFGARLVRKKE